MLRHRASASERGCAFLVGVKAYVRRLEYRDASH
jgi:hypothetical protein